jgi:hypothetical protein
MKCGIITLHTPHNFGAMLQAYALQFTISEMGHEVEIIDHGVREPPPQLFSKEGIKKLPYALVCLLRKKHRDRKYHRFNSFSDQYLKLSQSYKEPAELSHASMNYAALICGSDQIWNPTYRAFDPKFFLDFGPLDAIRIAYAPSFGVSEVPPELHQNLSELLDNLDFLSCREKSGVRLMEGLTKRETAHVVDPTMLVPAEHWIRISKQPADLPSRYILAYALDNSRDFGKSVSQLARKLSLPVVCIETGVRSPKFRCDHIIRDAGPLEFLGLLSKAEFVISNSFHGCIFSILFNKQFFSPRHGHSNERMRNLFEWTQIPNAQDLEVALSASSDVIDYLPVNLILEQAASQSATYLSAALDNKHSQQLP